MKCQEYESQDVTYSYDVTQDLTYSYDVIHDVTAEEVFKHVDILEEVVREDSSRVELHVSDQFLECILDDEPEHSEPTATQQSQQENQLGFENPDHDESVPEPVTKEQFSVLGFAGQELSKKINLIQDQLDEKRIKGKVASFNFKVS